MPQSGDHMNHTFSMSNQIPKFDVMRDIPKRAMVIFAHPDDAEIGAGATAARWSSEGCEITYLQCTTGSSGSNDTKMTSDRIVSIRSAEQRAAADIIGVGEIVVLNHPDGELEANRIFLEEVVYTLRKYRPEIVLTHDQHRINRFQHRDHRQVGTTVQDAIYPYARDHLHFPDQLTDEIKTYKVKHLFFWGSDQPNIIIDVTDSIDKKIEALEKHESQISGLSFGSDLDLHIRKQHMEEATSYNFEYGETFRMLTARK
ncbi:MAG: PIG-L family deacetylase [SAR202 cluster bacterium]|nr:PIG-L family deacetylase [SAR202 cluster bacterium]